MAMEQEGAPAQEVSALDQVMELIAQLSPDEIGMLKQALEGDESSGVKDPNAGAGGVPAFGA